MTLDLTPVVWRGWCLTFLAMGMVMAVESDLRERRIPNVLVLFMLLAGATLNAVGPANGSEGVFSYFPGPLGAGRAFLGALVGLGLFLPLYLLRAMGAGDAKLLAAVGAFVGPVDVVSVALCILVAGGPLAIARMLWRRKSRLVLGNVVVILGSWAAGVVRPLEPAAQSGERVPYALAFAGGLLAYGYWRLSGHPPLIGL